MCVPSTTPEVSSFSPKWLSKNWPALQSSSSCFCSSPVKCSARSSRSSTPSVMRSAPASRAKRSTTAVGNRPPPFGRCFLGSGDEPRHSRRASWLLNQSHVYVRYQHPKIKEGQVRARVQPTQFRIHPAWNCLALAPHRYWAIYSPE